MARNITTNANVVITMNGKQADATMKNLEAEAKRLKTELEKAKQSGDTLTMTRLHSELDRVNSQLTALRTNTVQVEEVLRNLDKAKPKDLQKALTTLKAQLNGIERGSEAWKRQIANIRRVQEEINRVNAELRTQETLVDRVNGWWGKFQTVVLGAVAAISGLVAAGRNAVAAFAEMDESMANTRKFTGLTVEGVNKLNESFKKLDTRTARQKLNDYAQEAGRLGKSTQISVMDYVKAANIINVALSDLGEGATQKIAKLANIFKLEDLYGTYNSMLKIGSVVNVLSQNCTASKPYLVEFASRLAGVGNQAHISLQNIIGFGAVLDANAQKVEASATAISQVLTRMYRDPAKYAKVAGLDIKQFSNLLKKDANEALLQFLETLGRAGNMDVLAPMFADMGENGARVINALSTLSKHIDEVRWQQGNANEAFKKGTSVLKEYNIFNNTAQAGIDKAKARLSEIAIELGEKLYPIMKHIYTSSSLFLRTLSKIVTFLINNHRAIISLTTAILAYNVAVNFAAIKTTALLMAQKAAVVVANSYKSVVILLTALNATLTRNTTQAAAAMRLFNAVCKANPIGLLAAAVAGLVTLLSQVIFKTDEYRKSLNEAMKSASDFSDKIQKEIEKIDEMFEALKKARKGTEEYDKAKNNIISKYGIYLKGLIDEKGEITNLALAYDRLTFAAEKSVRARGIAEAKNSLAQSHYSHESEEVGKLREALESLGMAEKDIYRLTSEIASLAGRGIEISKTQAFSEIFNFTRNNRRGLKKFTSDNPISILLGMDKDAKEYQKRVRTLDDMNINPAKGLDSNELDEAINTISSQLANTPSQVIVVDMSFKTKDFGDDGKFEDAQKVMSGLVSTIANRNLSFKGNPFDSGDKSRAEYQQRADHLLNLAESERDPEKKKRLRQEAAVMRRYAGNIGSSSISSGATATTVRTAPYISSEEMKLSLQASEAYNNAVIEKDESKKKKLLADAESLRKKANALRTDGKGLEFTGSESVGSSVVFALNRAEAEDMLRELMYERSTKPDLKKREGSIDDNDFSDISYNSTKQTEKERKKQEAEDRRTAVKAKKEFREGLDAIKAARIAADQETTAAYAAGEIEHLDYVKGKHDNEIRYLDDSISFFQEYFAKIKDSYIEDDKDYQDLLSRKQDAEINFQKEILNIKVKDIDRTVKARKSRENLEYSKILQPTLRDKYDHEQRLNEIKADGLRRQRDLYTKGSKEWIEFNQKLADNSEDREAKVMADFYARFNAMKKEYMKVSPAEKFRMEMEVLDILREKVHMTVAEYGQLQKAIAGKYGKELPGASEVKAGSLKEKRDKEYKEIDEAVLKGLISKEEGKKRKDVVDSDFFDGLISKIKGTAGAWADLCIDMADAWQDLFSGLGEVADGGLGKIAKVAQTTFAFLNAGFQTASEFAKENSKIAQAEITKRYDHEIKLAQGNSYLVSKLEKEKEEKIAEEKNKASQKEYRMKIFAAVADTAVNALRGYGAGLQAGFPMALWLAPLLAGMAVAQGAAQVALLTKQQQAASAQGYSEGGFTKPGDKDEVAGVVHAGEWVASQKLLANPVARPMINFLEKAQRSNTVGSLSYRDASRIVTGQAAVGPQDSAPAPAVVQVAQPDRGVDRLADVADRLAKRLDRPFVTVNTMTGDHGIEQTRKEYRRYIDNKNRYRR